jgi:hypothetical protein
MKKITLTRFKQMIQSCKINGIKIATKVVNKNNEVIKENEFAPVNIIQSNAFTLLRNGKNSYLNFAKSSEYNFEAYPIEQHFKDGGKILIEFSDRTFFGI